MENWVPAFAGKGDCVGSDQRKVRICSLRQCCNGYGNRCVIRGWMQRPASQSRRIHPPLRRQGPNFVAASRAWKIGYRPSPVKVIVLAATREKFESALCGSAAMITELVALYAGGCSVLLLNREEFTLPCVGRGPISLRHHGHGKLGTGLRR